ncbi:MAG: L,D-transpeptidase [Candidatus Kapaibacteriales bacterium]
MGFFAINNFTTKNIRYFPNPIELDENDYILYFLPFYDTMFYLGDYYFEIKLKYQMAYLFSKDGKIDSFAISSGNPNLKKGISTPAGLFAVQNKSPIQISRQFENTEMIYWIGFNGNIGFHGLKTKGYYTHLGRRPSSHGCIRVSLEDGEQIYNSIKIGTPVLVYENKPFRIIKFAKWKDFNPDKDFLIYGFNKEISKFFYHRQKNIFDGKYYLFGRERIFLAPRLKSIFSTIQVESAKTIPIQKPLLFKMSGKQILPLHSLNVAQVETISDTCPIPAFMLR